MQGKQLKSLFRAKLKSRRLECGLSQKGLADRIAAHQPYVADLESGKRTPTLDTIAKLGEALNVPPDFFLSQEILHNAS